MIQNPQADILALIREALSYEADAGVQRTIYVMAVLDKDGHTVMREDFETEEAAKIVGEQMAGYSAGWTFSVTEQPLADTDAAKADLLEWFTGWRLKASQALMAYKTPEPEPAKIAFTVGVTLDGGLVQDVWTNTEGLAITLVVTDYDVEGSDEARMIEWADGDQRLACISTWEADEFIISQPPFFVDEDKPDYKPGDVIPI